MLLAGSGDAFTIARVLALAPWAVRENPPPSRAATTSGSPPSLANIAPSRPPPTGRTTVCTESHRESAHGTLSTTNSTT